MMPFKLYNHPPRGTTLVETLVFTAIGSMLLLAVSAVYFSGLNSRAIIDSQQRLLYVDEFIAATLQDEMVSSHNVIAPESGSGTSLVFYSFDESNNITVSQSGTDLFMQIGAGAMIQLNSLGIRVTDFQVTRLSGIPNSVRIEISYEVDSVRGRVIAHTNSFTITLKYE